MGSVYEVRQRSTGRRRALKVMLFELANDADLRRRFEQEARCTSLVESPHVVDVIAAGVEQGQPWILMEYLEGEDLEHRISRGGPLGEMEVHRILSQVGHALGNAHRAGVVHRDLKTENIFLVRDGGGAPIVKLLDFGIAKVLDATGARTLANTAAVGSPIWMAPEQLEAGMVTAATDVWALGLVAFTMFTGKIFWKSFHGPNVHRVFAEIAIDAIPTANARAHELGVADDLPFWFDAWFARCVARDARKRFQNATEAIAALDVVEAAPQAPRSRSLLGYSLLAGAVSVATAAAAVFAFASYDRPAQAAVEVIEAPAATPAGAASAPVIVADPVTAASVEPPAPAQAKKARPKAQPPPAASTVKRPRDHTAYITTDGHAAPDTTPVVLNGDLSKGQPQLKIDPSTFDAARAKPVKQWVKDGGGLE